MQTGCTAAISLKQFQQSYKLSFTIVPDCVSTYLMGNKRLNRTAIDVYCILWQYGKFNSNGKVTISQTELGSLIGGKSRCTAHRAIKKLDGENIIKKSGGDWTHKDGRLHRDVFTYTTLVPAELVDKILADADKKGLKKKELLPEGKPYFETRNLSHQEQEKQEEAAAIEVEQTPKEKLLQAIQLIKESNIDEDEAVLIKKKILAFIEAQEQHDANREVTDSKEVVNILDQREQIESETPAVVTEKISPRTSNTKPTPAAQASTIKRFSLCSKFATGINLFGSNSPKLASLLLS